MQYKQLRISEQLNTRASNIQIEIGLSWNRFIQTTNTQFFVDIRCHSIKLSGMKMKRIYIVSGIEKNEIETDQDNGRRQPSLLMLWSNSIFDMSDKMKKFDHWERLRQWWLGWFRRRFKDERTMIRLLSTIQKR